LIRTFVYLIAAVIAISLLRMVMGAILREVAKLTAGGGHTGSSGSRQQAGVLRRDPVCGTYVAEGAGLVKTVAGKQYVFCSRECRDRFEG
jgi:YHS domain-containing protein